MLGQGLLCEARREGIWGRCFFPGEKASSHPLLMEPSSSAERVERERKLAFHRRASVSSPLGGGLEIASRILWRSRHMWPLPTRHPVPSTRQLVISTPTPAAVFLPGRGGLGPRERESPAANSIQKTKTRNDHWGEEERAGEGRTAGRAGPPSSSLSACT